MNLSVLHLYQTVWSALRHTARLKTVEQLCALTSEQLIDIKGIGPGFVRHIRGELQTIGSDLQEFGGFRPNAPELHKLVPEVERTGVLDWIPFHDAPVRGSD